MKIFFLSSGPILPLVGGRRLREFQMLKELAAIAPVRVLCTTKPRSQLKTAPVDSTSRFDVPHPKELRDFPHSVTFSFHPVDPPGIRSLLGFLGPHFAKGFSSDLMKVLKEEAGTGDLIWASRLRMAKYLQRLNPFLSKRKVFTVLDEHQIESDLLLDEAFQSFRNWDEGISAMQVARYERALTKEAQVVITTSPIDAHRVQKLSPKSRVKVIPFELSVEAYQPKNPPPKKNQIVFIADLEYAPNLDAIRYAQAEIFPRLKASLPRGEVPAFVVASSDPPPRGANFAVSHYDTPEELGRILSESLVAIFPLRQGRGNRIHLLEAMAAGLPIVCTGKAIDGLTVRPSFDLFLVNDEDGMASFILRLLRDEALRKSTGKNAHDTVLRQYGNQELHRSFQEILTALGVKKAGI